MIFVNNDVCHLWNLSPILFVASNEILHGIYIINSICLHWCLSSMAFVANNLFCRYHLLKWSELFSASSYWWHWPLMMFATYGIYKLLQLTEGSNGIYRQRHISSMAFVINCICHLSMPTLINDIGHQWCLPLMEFVSCWNWQKVPMAYIINGICHHRCLSTMAFVTNNLFRQYHLLKWMELFSDNSYWWHWPLIMFATYGICKLLQLTEGTNGIYHQWHLPSLMLVINSICRQ